MRSGKEEKQPDLRTGLMGGAQPGIKTSCVRRRQNRSSSFLPRACARGGAPEEKGAFFGVQGEATRACRQKRVLPGRAGPLPAWIPLMPPPHDKILASERALLSLNPFAPAWHSQFERLDVHERGQGHRRGAHTYQVALPRTPPHGSTLLLTADNDEKER